MRTALITTLVVSFVTSVAFAQGVEFSGQWALNTKLSQDPFDKIYTAMGSEQLKGAGTAAYNSVNSATLLRDTDRAGTLRSLLDYAEVLERVELEQSDNELTISVGAGDEFFSLFYLDGEKHKTLTGKPDELGAAFKAIIDRAKADPGDRFSSKEELLQFSRDVVQKAESEMPKWVGNMPNQPVIVVPFEEHEEGKGMSAHYRPSSAKRSAFASR